MTNDIVLNIDIIWNGNGKNLTINGRKIK